MPLIKPKFKAGVVKDDSALSAEGTWIDADKIRFDQDNPQVIGGWTQPAVAQDPAQATVFDSNVFDSDVFRTGLVPTDAMYPGQVRGAHAWNDLDATAFLAWGTSQGLFVLHEDTIYDITPDGFAPETTTDGSMYGTGNYGENVYGRKASVVWSLDNWGQNLLACPRGGGLYEWTPGTEKALTVSGAPTAINFMFVSPERIVVLLGTQEFGGSLNPMLVRWCDQGVNTDWTPSSFNIAGEFPLAHGANLISGLAARGQNLIWSDTSLYTMQFTGDVSSVFVIRAVGHGCGIIGPHAAAASDAAVYWMSRDNCYGFTGQVPSVLASTLRRDVFENIEESQEWKCHVGWNTGFSEPWFFYPDKRDGTGECSRYVMLNKSGAWANGSFNRTAWVRAGVFPFPIAFSDNYKLYNQEVPGAGDAGDPLDAFVESGFVDVGDGDTLYIIKRIVPDFDDQGPDIDMTLKTRMWPNGSITTRGPFTATPTTEKLDMRVKAREIAVRLESSGIDSSFWALGAIALDAQESGEKR